MRKLLFSGLILLSGLLSLAQDMHTPQGLKVGDKAPYFNGIDQNGKTVGLQNILKTGPLVLIFYRGQWCPYCNKELSNLQDSFSMIHNAGAKLVAVTPETRENVKKTIAKTKAGYSILSDDSLRIMKNYDVAYPVQGDLLAKYTGYGIDFKQANGANGADLPVPAVYIISSQGIITYVCFNPNFRTRPSVAEILKHL